MNRTTAMRMQAPIKETTMLPMGLVADQPDDDVADDPIAAPLHDLPGQEACDEAHDQPGDDAARFQVNLCENRHDLAPLCGETRRRGPPPTFGGRVASASLLI